MVCAKSYQGSSRLACQEQRTRANSNWVRTINKETNIEIDFIVHAGDSRWNGGGDWVLLKSVFHRCLNHCFETWWQIRQTLNTSGLDKSKQDRNSDEIILGTKRLVNQRARCVKITLKPKNVKYILHNCDQFSWHLPAQLSQLLLLVARLRQKNQCG